MIIHFGMKIGDSKVGYKLTRENYVRICRKSTFITGEVYDEDFCRNHAIDCLINYDYNMEFFSLLDKDKFRLEIKKFLEFNPQFEAVKDINDYRKKPGFYLMVFDEYCQAYIGGSKDIYRRIHDHWIGQKSFDRLIFGYIDSSIISIDSFRPLDTTRLYIHEIDDTYTAEDRYINNINPIFMCNRTIGGLLEGGLLEAIQNRKERQFKSPHFENSITINYADNLNPTPVQLHEIYMLVNEQGFFEKNVYKTEINNICEMEYSGKYGMYVLISSLDQNLVTVTKIS